ncbi:MAG: FapA family protein [Oscillospiraceae bacterium]|nr:FapA family protein [Oscillospiraceae bacterium]
MNTIYITEEIREKNETIENTDTVTDTVIDEDAVITEEASESFDELEHEAVDESLSINITHDELKAEAILNAPEYGGAFLDMEAAKRQLSDAGVVFGIDEVALSALLKLRDYDRPYLVAEAVPPVEGANAKLAFNFSTDERTGSPMEIGGGRVDYKSLDLYVPVTEGQLLVTKLPMIPGKPGTSVTGKEIPSIPVKDISLPKGKNVQTNESKTEMYALCSGMVEFINNSINVSNVYNIKGDCDISVGNIDFDGCVHVCGTVRSGSTIKATGGVIVEGCVEAATIIAGGNVEIKGGVQGADKALIESGGAVSMLYIEHGSVHADGPVTFDVSLHSIIEAGETLTAKGRRGAIIGGRAGAAGNITANYIGTVSNTNTEVAVGVMPRKRTRLQVLEKELSQLSTEQLNLDKLDFYLEKSKEHMDPAKWELLSKSSIENRHLNTERIIECTEEVDKLKYELEHATDGKIHVLDTVFSGSRVLIGSDTYTVNNEVSYVSFKINDCNVVCEPCEISKR